MHKSVIVLIAFAAFAIAHVLSADAEDTSIVIEGVDITKLDYQNLLNFSDALDEKFAGELDTHAFKAFLAEKKGRIEKRWSWGSLAKMSGKFLLKSAFSKSVGIFGKKLYKKVKSRWSRSNRNVFDTFHGLRPDNVRTRYGSAGETVMMGEIGDTHVTARSSSPSGLPTFVFNGENLVREIQFADQ